MSDESAIARGLPAGPGGAVGQIVFTSEAAVEWNKKGKKVVLRVVSYNVVAADSLPVHEAVVNSNFEPVLFTFPIKAFGKDSTSTVIYVTPLFTKDVKPLGFPERSRKNYK